VPEPTVQATFNMPPELHKKLTDTAHAEGRTMREIVEEALKNYFARSENESQERG
jgi:predicted transcriptional regulator